MYVAKFSSLFISSGNCLYSFVCSLWFLKRLKKEHYIVLNPGTLNILNNVQVKVIEETTVNEVVLHPKKPQSTFNLSLTEDEKQAKQDVVLPYTNLSNLGSNQKLNSSSVIFVSGDDFDSDDDADDDIDL
eukprot:TRINITY_DN2739_c0_g1_i18.p1 TRINITY_DN2739_c0_g1~~TRINITY_DN2739_c0_g1_i18.p1  ORF type:complete len:130 (+),score=28.97 TRINITY_DN2739_c0_g1_i18:762-1151(+)